MGQKMAPGTGLTPRQKQFLAVVLQEPYILKRFYLTGGTALACWYLHHRESQDIDLFSEREVNASHINKWFLVNKKTIGFISLTHKEELGFNLFDLKFPDGPSLRVDFNYYPSERIEKGLNWHGLEIDSLYDIAVNKLNTITMNPRGRDYIDLYFILREKQWSLRRLRQDAGIKFGIHSEVTYLAKQFLRVSEFTDFPKMLIHFDKKEMEDFFLGLAKSLEKEIFVE